MYSIAVSTSLIEKLSSSAFDVVCVIAQCSGNARLKSKLLLVNHFKDNPKKTAESERGDFYVTGDRGTMDEDGYFQFIGRDDDIIISSGSVCTLPF